MRTLIDVLGSRLTDPIAGSRVGSFVFGPSDTVFAMKYTPKIQVKYGDGDESERYSYGTNYTRDKVFSFNLLIYTIRDVTYSGSKNEDFFYYMYDHIEETLLSHAGSFGGHLNVGAGEEPIQDAEKQRYIGVLPLTFKVVQR